MLLKLAEGHPESFSPICNTTLAGERVRKAEDLRSWYARQYTQEEADRLLDAYISLGFARKMYVLDCTGKMEVRWIAIRFTWKTAQGTTEIVFDATCASNIKDQAKQFVLVEACYKALPRVSKSRQSNESTVDSSCTSLTFAIQH